MCVCVVIPCLAVLVASHVKLHVALQCSSVSKKSLVKVLVVGFQRSRLKLMHELRKFNGSGEDWRFGKYPGIASSGDEEGTLRTFIHTTNVGDSRGLVDEDWYAICQAICKGDGGHAPQVLGDVQSSHCSINSTRKHGRCHCRY